MPTKNTIQKIGCTLASQAPSSPPTPMPSATPARRAEAGDERAFGIGEREQSQVMPPTNPAPAWPLNTPTTIGAPMLMRESVPRRRSRCKIRARGCKPLGKSGGGDVTSVMSAGTAGASPPFLYQEPRALISCPAYFLACR